MAEISLKIQADFANAKKQFDSVDMSSESFQKTLAKLQKQMDNGSIDKFMNRNQLSAAAMTAAKGSAAGLQKELSGLRGEIQRMIKAGLDPMNPALDKMKVRMSEIQKQLPNTSGGFSGLGNAAMIAATAIGSSMIVGKLKDINVAALSAAAAMEQQKVAFTTMLGSAEKASGLLAQMQDFAASTPFSFNEIVDAGKRMIAFGFASEEVVQKLGMVGDVAAGLSIPVGDLTYLFGQVKTQGKAMTQDLNQFANRGIPIFEEVAKAMGVPVKEVRKLAEQGKITYDVINKAFENMTGSGGKFGGLMAAQSKTLTGQWSNFNDQLDKTKIILGEGLMAGAKKDLSVMSALLSKYTEIVQENQKREQSEARYISLQGKVSEAIIGTQEKLEMIAQLDRDRRGAALVYQGYLKGDIALSQQQINQLEQRLGLQRSLSDIAAQANKNELESWKQRGLIVGEVQKKVEKGVRGSGGTGTKKTESQMMMDDLAKMKNVEAQAYADRLKSAEEFFVQKAELEKVSTSDLMAWQFEQASLIASNDKLSYEQKLAAMKALETATAKHSQKMVQAQLQYGLSVLSSTGDLLTNIQTVMKNSGKESRTLAIAMKGLAMAQAGINAALAITKTLADGGPFPLNVINAAIIGAAGAAQIAAIATTPIPKAETGLSNYTVPDIRSNRNDGAAVMAQAGETVSVSPRGEENNNLTNINITVSEQTIFSIVAKGIKTGQIDLNNNNIGRGVFAN